MAVRGARALSLFALLVAGCSGAGNTDLFGTPSEPQAEDTSPTEPVPSATTPVTPPSNNPPPPVPVVPDAGPNDAEPPPSKCTPEVEPNSTMTKATTFTVALCGKINSYSDTDYGRFVVPAGATSVAITHAEQGGMVAYRYYVNGQFLNIIDSDDIKVTPGQVYSVQMKLAPTSNGEDRPTYELGITFQ
jgi:hypothetical protein